MASDADKPARIPAEEVDALIKGVCEALELAHRGKTAEGYAVLLEGCGRAQEAAAGEPWEEALTGRWQGALSAYGQRWPVGRA